MRSMSESPRVERRLKLLRVGDASRSGVRRLVVHPLFDVGSLRRASMGVSVYEREGNGRVGESVTFGASVRMREGEGRAGESVTVGASVRMREGEGRAGASVTVGASVRKREGVVRVGESVTVGASVRMRDVCAGDSVPIGTSVRMREGEVRVGSPVTVGTLLGPSGARLGTEVSGRGGSERTVPGLGALFSGVTPVGASVRVDGNVRFSVGVKNRDGVSSRGVEEGIVADV